MRINQAKTKHYFHLLFSKPRQLKRVTCRHLSTCLYANFWVYAAGGQRKSRCQRTRGTETRRQETNRQNANFIFSSFWRRDSCKSATNAQALALAQSLLKTMMMMMMMVLGGITWYPCDSFSDFFCALWLCWHFYATGIEAMAKWKCLGKIFAFASMGKFAYL